MCCQCVVYCFKWESRLIVGYYDLNEQVEGAWRTTMLHHSYVSRWMYHLYNFVASVEVLKIKLQNWFGKFILHHGGNLQHSHRLVGCWGSEKKPNTPKCCLFFQCFPTLASMKITFLITGLQFVFLGMLDPPGTEKAQWSSVQVVHLINLL